MGKLRHVVSFSGGKDSTAMLLRMIEGNWQIELVSFYAGIFFGVILAALLKATDEYNPPS